MRISLSGEASQYVWVVTGQGKSEKRQAQRSKSAGRIVGAVIDGVILMAVLLFSAITVIVIALGAPLVLAVSAVTGAFVPKRVRGHWRVAHAG